MTIRKPTSYIQNRWYDGQRADQVDMTVEQDRNVGYDSSIIQNHFGSGVLSASPIQATIFDTDNLFPDQVALIVSNDFDGTGLRPLAQPSDATLGNQLEVELTDSDPVLNGDTTVGGRLSTKIFIVGLDFQGNLQYDRFYFYKKEKQVTKKHYALVLAVFFNDFYGSNACSRRLGGRVIIRETLSFQLSRDGMMISQDVEPNIFFRDFKNNAGLTLSQTIQAGIGLEYSVDALNINTTVKRNFEFVPGDVVTRAAQKFLANNNNIQKITLLLGVGRNSGLPIEDQFNWSGELVVSFYELQSSVSCPTDLVPELAIEFEPNPSPITQFSIEQSTLKDYGYILTDVLQPVDFVFNASVLGNAANPRLVPGKHYAISIGRAGDASVGTVFTGIGNSQSTDDRFTIFTGEWTDVPEEDMWYQVWSDTAKVSDGFAYDYGNGMQITKTDVNVLGAVVDYSFDQNPFVSTGEDTLNTAVVEAIAVQSQQEQDERTGNPVYARQQFEPSFSFVTNTTLATLRASSEPLVIGCARDTNPKSNNSISGTQQFPGLASGNIFSIINPDVDLLAQQLVGSKLIPSDICLGTGYKIVKVRTCTDGYGDVNGDGDIDVDDLVRAVQLVGQSLELDTTQELIRDGYIGTLELIRADVDGDGYITSNDIDLISEYIARNINSFPVGSSFTHIEIEVQNISGRYDGYYDCGDGYIRLGPSNIVNPGDLTQAELEYYGFNSLPILETDPIFTVVPFVPVTYTVQPLPFWQDYLLQFSSEARLVPCTFTYLTDPSNYFDESTGLCLSQEMSVCQEVAELGGSCNPGRNDFFIPDNLIMGKGQILTKDGSFFRQDFEVHTVTLELPSGVMFEHAVMNVFEKLLVDSGNGLTSAGYLAARFADCSTVQADALARNQIRFGVSIQSIYPSIDGYDSIDGYGIIIDDIIGVTIDQETGIMILSMKDIDYSIIYSELRTKILITAYLKKAGWNNVPLTIPSNQVSGLFVSGVT